MCVCCPDFKTHLQSINLAVSATAKGREVANMNKREKKMAKEHAAFKRLRKDGLETKSLRNADVLEQADSRYEIERSGKLMNKEQQSVRKLTETIMDDTGVGKVIGSGV